MTLHIDQHLLPNVSKPTNEQRALSAPKVLAVKRDVLPPSTDADAADASRRRQARTRVLMACNSIMARDAHSIRPQSQMRQ